RIFLVALAIFLPRARDALGGVTQALALGIVARPADQRADRFLDLFGYRRLAARIVLVRTDEATHCSYCSSSAALPVHAGHRPRQSAPRSKRATPRRHVLEPLGRLLGIDDLAVRQRGFDLTRLGRVERAQMAGVAVAERGDHAGHRACP